MHTIETIGGSGPDLLFLHANAYPPGCYGQFLLQLRQHFTIHIFRQRPIWEGSDPSRFSSWQVLADDLIEALESSGLSPKVVAGHSMGAVAAWMSSIKRPDLFSQLVLIDPVFLPAKMTRWNPWIPHWLKKKMIPLIKIASRRRDRWPDRDSAREHLGSKKVFKRFDTAAFDDFIAHGLRMHGDELTLSYPRAWEARIYATAPNVWPLMSRSTIPAYLIKAQYSDVIFGDTWPRLQERLPHATFYEMPKVGHLMPMEAPERLARHIVEALVD